MQLIDSRSGDPGAFQNQNSQARHLREVWHGIVVEFPAAIQHKLTEDGELSEMVKTFRSQWTASEGKNLKALQLSDVSHSVVSNRATRKLQIIQVLERSQVLASIVINAR